MLSILGRYGTRLDLELLQRIREGKGQIEAVERIVVGSAIKQVTQAVVHTARNRNRIGGIVAIGHLRTAADCRSGKDDQVRDLTAVERHLQDSDVVDDLTNSRIPSLNQCRVRLHFHLVGDLTDLQNRIDGRVRIDFKNNPGLRIGLEARQRRFQAVGTDRQAR